MSEQELIWLATQALTHQRIVEIGSLMGRSTRALGDHTPGVVLAIDDWIGPREIHIPEAIRVTLYDRFTKNVSDLIAAQRVKPLRLNHADVDQLPADFHPDMVFIDGDHEYEAVKRDILTWRERMAPGGLLCGHDASDAAVRLAVVELIEHPAVVSDTEIWLEVA